MEGKKVPLYGDGMNVRDWIYVTDNCEGIDAVLHQGEIGEIYNIGGGNERSNIFITKKILEMLGKVRGHDRAGRRPPGARLPLFHRLLKGQRPGLDAGPRLRGRA